jgi:hypothetical protein
MIAAVLAITLDPAIRLRSCERGNSDSVRVDFLIANAALVGKFHSEESIRSAALGCASTT